MINTKIPVYEVEYKSDEELGVTAVSFVDNPAIGVDFISLKDEIIPIKLIEEERRVISPVLIPDKLIYRVIDGLECYIRFSAETIDKLAWNFYLNDRVDNVTYMHEQPDRDDIYSGLIEGVYCKDLWIVENYEDPIYEKYKFSKDKVTLGSWCIDYIIENDVLWNEIKSGDIRGLSVEAFISLKH